MMEKYFFYRLQYIKSIGMVVFGYSYMLTYIAFLGPISYNCIQAVTKYAYMLAYVWCTLHIQ